MSEEQEEQTQQDPSTPRSNHTEAADFASAAKPQPAADVTLRWVKEWARSNSGDKQKEYHLLVAMARENEAHLKQLDKAKSLKPKSGGMKRNIDGSARTIAEGLYGPCQLANKVCYLCSAVIVCVADPWFSHCQTRWRHTAVRGNQVKELQRRHLPRRA